MIELEKTFLIKRLPDLKDCESVEIVDIFIPKTAEHPNLRIRKIIGKTNRFEITRKSPIKNDKSRQREITIPLTKEEFDVLSKLDGKVLHKKGISTITMEEQPR